MSNAQRLYLHRLIQRKLTTEEDLRKRVAHQALFKRLQPLLDDTQQDFLRCSAAVERAQREAQLWVRGGGRERLKKFEERLFTLFGTRFDTGVFSRLIRRDNLPWRKPTSFFPSYDTVEEE